jgi:dienelactone hydrolase
MNHHRCSIRLLLVLFLTGSFLPADAQDRGRTVWIPMQEKAPISQPAIKLEATLHKPEGDGPFPLMIFNHGSTGMGRIPLDRTDNPWRFGADLVRKGIALLIPMRRGRGKSEGQYRESYECSLEHARLGMRYATESLHAVYEFLNRQAWVDRGKIILAGNSRGGILSVVYAAERSGSATGVVNFVGGWLGDECNSEAGIDVNATLFAEAGKKATVRHLFLYATRDDFYSVSSVTNYADVFRKAGGSVDFELYDMDTGANGHSLFYQYRRKWNGDLDAFLIKLGVWNPSQNR